MSKTTLALAGLELAKMWMEYSRRAVELTDEEAAAEWQKVTERAHEAEARWDASKKKGNTKS